MLISITAFGNAWDSLRDKEILERKLKTKSILTKKILITGGTGFIGYHLAKKCIKLNWKVTNFSSNKPNKLRKLKKVKYLIADISSKKDLKIR